jgi:DNA-binding GntR family transcriptional regulator
MEPELAAQSCALHSPQQLDELGHLVDGLTVRDPEAVWDVHRQFHLGIVAPAASAWDLRVLDQLWTAAERYTRLVFDFADATVAEQHRRVEVHRDICEAIRSGDEHGTRDAVRAHLQDNQSALLREIEKVERRTKPSTLT